MQQAFETLRLFNEKVARLEASRFAQRYGKEPPEVLLRFSSATTTSTGAATFEIQGAAESELAEHDQDDIDAFVLTYRMFIQANDRISIRALKKIYEEPWMPEEPAKSFAHARGVVNAYLDSPLTLTIYDQQIARRTLIDIMLYGGLAHSEPEKQEVFRNWTTSLAAGFFWAEFVVTMHDMLGYLRFFRDLNEAVIANLGSSRDARHENSGWDR
jgi:hypothetical protein